MLSTIKYVRQKCVRAENRTESETEFDEWWLSLFCCCHYHFSGGILKTDMTLRNDLLICFKNGTNVYLLFMTIYIWWVVTDFSIVWISRTFCVQTHMSNSINMINAHQLSSFRNINRSKQLNKYLTIWPMQRECQITNNPNKFKNRIILIIFANIAFQAILASTCAFFFSTRFSSHLASLNMLKLDRFQI